MMKDSKQIEVMDMNVTWFPKDLDVYDDEVGVVEATILTIVKIITLGMAVIAQRTFYRMMKRLPGRVINHILYPHMVCLIYYQLPYAGHYKPWLVYFLPHFSLRFIF